MKRQHIANGRIEEVKAPKFTEAKKSFLILYKVCGEWKQLRTKSEEKANELYADLCKRAEAAKFNVDLASTWMSQEQVRVAEFAFQAMENKGYFKIEDSDSSEKFQKAMNWMLEHYNPVTQKPNIEIYYQYFMKKQESRHIAASTIKDYKRMLGKFVAQHKGKIITEVSRAEIKDYIDEMPTNSARFKGHGYLQAFYSYCCGKNNTEMPEETWLDRNPINWEKEQYEVNQIESYNFEECQKVIAKAKEIGAEGYALMRLYSMMRYEEYMRFVKIGGEFISDNHPLINFENNTITLDNRIYKKRNRSESRGRYIQILPKFREVLEYLRDNKVSIAKPVNEKEIHAVIPEKAHCRNIWRHTAITMRLKHTSDILSVATEAGNSDRMIRDCYLNQKINKLDSDKFYNVK
jgi:hypothetical protein